MATITEAQKLQAFELFTLAIARNNEANAFSREAAKVLGVDGDGHISDAIFGYKVADASITNFEKVLELEGITVDREAA